MKPTKLQFQTELMRAQLFGEKCEHITAEQIMDAFRKGEEVRHGPRFTSAAFNTVEEDDPD